MIPYWSQIWKQQIYWWKSVITPKLWLSLCRVCIATGRHNNYLFRYWSVIPLGQTLFSVMLPEVWASGEVRVNAGTDASWWAITMDPRCTRKWEEQQNWNQPPSAVPIHMFFHCKYWFFKNGWYSMDGVSVPVQAKTKRLQKISPLLVFWPVGLGMKFP